MNSRAWHRRAWTPIVAVLLLGWTVGPAAMTSVSAEVSRPSQPAGSTQETDDELVSTGTWTGTTEGSVARTTKWLEAGYRMHGDFWFSVSAEGQVDGYAVVVYEPYFNTDGLNAALDYVKDVGIGSLGVFIPFPVDLAGTLGLSDMLAVRGQYEQPMSTMEGPITGTMADGQLSIEWADAQQIELPITVYMDGADGSEELTSEVLTTESPWGESAAVTEQAGLTQAVSVSGDSSDEDGVTIVSNNSWNAHAD